jgi:hypothetical protein
MSIQGTIVVVAALLPFAAVVGLLWLARMIREKRDADGARQIILTDAIHRELGAVAAPVGGGAGRGAGRCGCGCRFTARKPWASSPGSPTTSSGDSTARIHRRCVWC